MAPLLGLMLVLLASGCGRSHRSGEAAGALPTVRVSTLTIHPRSEAETVVLSGTLVPIQEAVLSTRLSGRITSMRVQAGDRVHRGEVLVKVDASDIQARTVQAEAGHAAALAGARQAEAAVNSARASVQGAESALGTARARLPEAKAQLALARIEYRRANNLYREGAAPRQRFDQADTDLKVALARVAQLRSAVSEGQAGVQRAQAGLKEARAAAATSSADARAAAAAIAVASSNLSYGEVRAPFDGVVRKKQANQGDMTTPGAPLLEVENPDVFWLEVPVPESYATHIRRGQSFPIHVSALHETVHGRVSQIVPAADPSSRTFTAKLTVENRDGRLISGMYATIRLAVGTHKAILVPPAAIVHQGQLLAVFLAGKDQHAHMRLVKTGETHHGMVEILSGLEPGDRLITSPAGLKDGSPLR